MQIRKLSVKQIVSPIVFDNLRNAVPGGLYDPAMGPLEQSGQCTTCKQGYMFCPGHFGHVELAVPVYNPLVFTTMFKLLRCTCLNCFRLKMLQTEVGGPPGLSVHGSFRLCACPMAAAQTED